MCKSASSHNVSCSLCPSYIHGSARDPTYERPKSGTVKLSRICPFCGRILLDQRLGINNLAVAAGGENAAKLLNLTGHCQVDEKLVDRPPRYWAPARLEPTMLSIKNSRQPQLDNTAANWCGLDS